MATFQGFPLPSWKTEVAFVPTAGDLAKVLEIVHTKAWQAHSISLVFLCQMDAVESCSLTIQQNMKPNVRSDCPLVQ